MYQIPGDYLMTYNPAAIEQHSDSSDFESDVSPKVSKIVGKHCLLDKKLKTKTDNLKYINQQVLNEHYDTTYDADTRNSSWKLEAVRSSKLFKRHKKVSRKRCNRVKSKELNCGDQVEVGQAKVSIIRCISSIFGRYVNNVKHTMSVIKENHPEIVTKDNSCQAYRRQKGTRLYDNEQCYSIRPVYEITSINNGAHAPCHTKMKNIHINRNPQSKNQYSITSLSLSSSDAAIEKQADDDAHRKFKKRLLSEIKQEYLQYRFAHMKKNQEQQCPSKLNNENPFEVITTSYQLLSKDQTSSDPNAIKKVQSSKFWDFIHDKICNRYQSSKSGKTGSCTCLKNPSSQNQRPCGPTNCEYYKGRNSPNNSSLTGIPEQNPNSTFIGGVDKICADNPLSLKEPNKIDVECTIECHCFPNKKIKVPSRAAKSIKQMKTNKTKSCQESHDPITEALAQKYNGEILCIHNPPCVLINGCLNLANPKELNGDVNLWPVVNQEFSFTSKKPYSQQYNYIKQSSQYAAPLLEMVQCQTPDYKAEKIIQSVCNHDPPCEVVRGCYKQKYEPMQLTSSDRLTTSDKLLHFFNGQKDDNVSDNSTQSADIAECKERNVFLTAREDNSTQVKSKIKMVCRHIPPCIMLPSCLARVVYGSCMTIEAIPDCLHRPPCDLIPACCRRQTKGMASVSSQYPNGCRVV